MCKDSAEELSLLEYPSPSTHPSLLQKVPRVDSISFLHYKEICVNSWLLQHFHYNGPHFESHLDSQNLGFAQISLCYYILSENTKVVLLFLKCLSSEELYFSIGYFTVLNSFTFSVPQRTDKSWKKYKTISLIWKPGGQMCFRGQIRLKIQTSWFYTSHETHGENQNIPSSKTYH